MSVRILVADDHLILRQGLRTLLEREADLQVVGEAEDGLAAIRLAAEVSPDVVIMDITMPGLNGIEATRRIRAAAPGIRVIALSMHSHRAHVREMFQAGAAGFLLKECAFAELVRCIQAVLRGHLYLCPRLSTDLVRDHLLADAAPSSSAFSLLTGREREVLQLIAEGQTTKEIGALLGVSPKTVETFRQQIMKKLDLHSIAALTKYAVREGLTGA